MALRSRKASTCFFATGVAKSTVSCPREFGDAGVGHFEAVQAAQDCRLS